VINHRAAHITTFIYWNKGTTNMTFTVTSNGKRCLALISCHRNGSFSFFKDDRWGLWKMEELGVNPS
jgi:hypothetical protein